MKEKGVIDVSRISKTDQKLIARRFLPLVEEFFKDPKNQVEFEEWKQKRQSYDIIE